MDELKEQFKITDDLTAEWALNLLKTTLNQLMMFGTAELERRDAPLIKAAIEAMEGAKA